MDDFLDVLRAGGEHQTISAMELSWWGRVENDVADLFAVAVPPGSRVMRTDSPRARRLWRAFRSACFSGPSRPSK